MRQWLAQTGFARDDGRLIEVLLGESGIEILEHEGRSYLRDRGSRRRGTKRENTCALRSRACEA